MAEDPECGNPSLTQPPGRARFRRPSYFQPRGVCSRDEAGDPITQKLHYFYQELSHFCNPNFLLDARSSYQCFATRYPSEYEENKIKTFADLWRLSTGGGEEVNDEQLFSLVFLSEMQTLSQGIQRNNILVDGLFSCILENVNEHIGKKLHHGPDGTAIVRLSQGLPSLLEHYWRPPSSESELPTYLAVGKSFVNFIRSRFGRSGINSMMKQLAHTESETMSGVDLTIRRKSLQDLEAIWLSYLKYESQAKCQISGFRFSFLLLKLSVKSSACLVFLACLFFMADVGCYIYNTIAFGEVSGIASIAAQDKNVTHLSSLVQPASLLLGTVIIRCCASVVLAALMSSVAIRLSHTLRNKIITAIYSQPLELHQDKLISIFSQDVAQLEVGVGFALANVIRGIVVSVASIIVIIAIAWQIGLALALAFVGTEIFLSLLGRKLAYYSFRQELATGRLSSVAREVIDGHLENRVFGLFNYWITRYQTMHMDVYRRKAFKSLFTSQAIFLLHFFIPLLLTTGVLIGGFTMVVFGYTTFNNALTSFILFASAASALRVAGSFLPMLETARTALSRILALCNHCGCDLQPPSKLHPTIGETAVKVDKVSFAYSQNSAYWQLHEVSLSINHGEHVAIVGPSGSGKSTLLKVVMGYYKPVEGNVYVYGHNMATTSVSSLPVSVVAQNAHFFQNMSVLQNLQLANWAATLEDIRRATEASDIHEWICSLPQGYNTVVSSDFAMSNGQRQRLGVARSLLKQPKLLILDEVTSALDPTTSKSVTENILKVAKNVSVVAVTHSLEEAMMFDRIVFVSHGVVKENGSHSELMSIQGYYFRMWKNIKHSEDQDQPVFRKPFVFTSRRGNIYAERYFDSEQIQHRCMPQSCISPMGCGNIATSDSNAPGNVQLGTLQEVEREDYSSVSTAVNSTDVSDVGQPRRMLSYGSAHGSSRSRSAFANLSASVYDRSVRMSARSLHSRPRPVQESTPMVAVPWRRREGDGWSASVDPRCAEAFVSRVDTTPSASGASLPVPPPLPTPHSASRDGQVAPTTLRPIPLCGEGDTLGRRPAQVTDL